MKPYQIIVSQGGWHYIRGRGFETITAADAMAHSTQLRLQAEWVQRRKRIGCPPTVHIARIVSSRTAK